MITGNMNIKISIIQYNQQKDQFLYEHDQMLINDVNGNIYWNYNTIKDALMSE